MKDPRRISLYTLSALTWTLLALALLSGCVTQSIHPLYDDQTVVLDNRLVGSWSDGDAVWSFTADGADGYRMVHEADGNTIPASAHLARIDGRLYLDIYVDELPRRTDDLYKTLFLPLHMLFRVDGLDDTLRTSGLDYAWLEEYLDAHPDEIDYVVADDRVVFTDSTAALQAFVAAHADDAEAWEEAIVMERQPINGR